MCIVISTTPSRFQKPLPFQKKVLRLYNPNKIWQFSYRITTVLLAYMTLKFLLGKADCTTTKLLCKFGEGANILGKIAQWLKILSSQIATNESLVKPCV